MNSSVDSSMTMSDRLLMEPTFDLEEDEEVESVETGGEKSEGSANKAPEDNNLDDVQVNTCDQGAAVGDQEDLEELEQSLQALERLDRSSPDLWPDQIPGVHQFLPTTPGPGHGEEVQGEYLQNLSREDLETLMQLGGLSVPQLMGEVKRLQNIAYQLGQEETKEMTRGKYLNILRKRNSSGRR